MDALERTWAGAVENLQVVERREVLGEQTAFVVRVVPRRRRTVEIRESLADCGPEFPIRRPPRHRCTPGASAFYLTGLYGRTTAIDAAADAPRAAKIIAAA